MDNNWSPMFYNQDDQDQGQKKQLFSNRQNLYGNFPNQDNNGTESANSYAPEKTSKLWNHIITRPYTATTHQQPSHISREKLDDTSQMESYADMPRKPGSGEKSYIDLLEEKAEPFSDIFSEADDTTMLNKLQTLTFRTPTTSFDAKGLKPLEHPKPTTIHAAEPIYEDPEAAEPDYPNHEYNIDAVYDPPKRDEPHVDVSETTHEADSLKHKLYDPASSPPRPDLSAVTVHDPVRFPALSNSPHMQRSPQHTTVKHEIKTVPLTSARTANSLTDAGNPFDSQNGFAKDKKRTDPRKETRLKNLAEHLNREHREEHKPQRPFERTKRGTPDVLNYSNYTEYNPFSVFSVGKGAGTARDEELKKLKSVLTSSTHSEDTLIKYFTEAICITSNEMMKLIVAFLVDLIRENHKHRQFAVRLMLCALSFHPEEFVAAFRVEYLYHLFIPQIDDNVGIYFMKMLLSYKSTFNSKTEVRDVPVSLDDEGQLVYPQAADPAATAEANFRDGKIEMLYALKILTERSRVGSVFDLPNSILREQLCMIWYEMPKTIPNVNMVEVLLNWTNSNEDLETKKYPFLLLERIRDTHQFPKGNILLMSQFFLFALKHKAKLSKDLEYVISLVNGTKSDPEGGAETGRRKTKTPRGFTDPDRDESVLEMVLYNILCTFNERDMLDLWCLLCVIPWKLSSPEAPFSNLLKTTLNMILNITSLNFDVYAVPTKNNKIRLDILENCLRICLVRCSCPINSLNALLEMSLLLNPGQNAAEDTITTCLQRNGMILNSLCNFLWKCHFLWTRIKDGVSTEVLIVVTELYKILATYTPAKPLDDNAYKVATNTAELYRFFSATDNGLWSKITTFLPQIDLNHYFTKYGGTDGYPTSDHAGAQDRYGFGEAAAYSAPSQRDTARDEDAEFVPAEVFRVVGLKNLGNSCYLNSLLQSLYHTRLFVHNLMRFQEGNKNEMVAALAKLFKKMRTTDKRVVTPKHVFRLVTAEMTHSQQDVTEAIRIVSEAIDTNLELWKSVFAGLVVRRIKCLRCHSLSDNEETMYDFSLSLKKAKTVQQMLDNFCNVETLSGENKYSCLKCNKQVRANMWNVIVSPPSHLIIILNRNTWNLNEGNKVMKRVKIDSEVYISGFQYHLYGAIIHSGDSTESGHYYFIGCESESFQDWYKVDDSVVTTSHAQEVDDISRDATNTHVPYVLLYRCLQAPETRTF